MENLNSIENEHLTTPQIRSTIDRRLFLGTEAASAVFLAPGVGWAAVAAEPDETPDRNGDGNPSKQSGTGRFSLERLGRMHEVMAGYVDRDELPGMVTVVCREDELHVEAIGTTAFGRSDRMRRDSIFRIASITKPITAAAAMILVEECVIRLDDPVDRWLPELADRCVLKSLESPLDDTVPAKRPITVRDLLTFKLGIGAITARPGTYPIQKAMEDAGIAPGPTLPAYPPDELMQRYGSIPLVHQPGEGWLYSSGSDILGILIARASGQSFGRFLKERIFDPLGMVDTGFHVPAAKIDRLTTSYRTDHEAGRLVVFDEAADGRFTKAPDFDSGAAGLVSTVDDYFAFCRMMLAKGEYDGMRILSRASVELMTMNHITEQERAASRIFLGSNRGWGFGMAVYTRRDDLSSVPGRFGWDGGFGTSAYIDPGERLIGILFTQRMMDSPQPPPVYCDFWTSTYQAISD